jgi:hypothetical protein
VDNPSRCRKDAEPERSNRCLDDEEGHQQTAEEEEQLVEDTPPLPCADLARDSVSRPAWTGGRASSRSASHRPIVEEPPG